MLHRLNAQLALAALVATSCAFAPAARAETMNFKATLDGKSEVPPTKSSATGQATFTYDSATKQLTWNITYTGLSGPATAGHIHGPAEPGKNAGVAVPFSTAASPIKGSKVLTEAQAKDLMAGKYYVNIHTAANKDGEIRGNITK
jgi:Cu/Zn superoxide dismutase